MESRRGEARLQYRQGARYLGCAIADTSVIIGGRDADIRVPGTTITRRHARIYRVEGRVWIEDLGGDGVWVNGEKVARAQLNNPDKLLVGGLELQFWEG